MSVSREHERLAGLEKAGLLEMVATKPRRGAVELAQAIPPAYTEHIGHYLMTELNARQAA